MTDVSTNNKKDSNDSDRNQQKKVKLVVAGDINIDCYFWQREPQSISQPNTVMNYQLYKGLYKQRIPGGAVIVSTLLKANKEIREGHTIDTRFTDFPKPEDIEKIGIDQNYNENGIQYDYDQLPYTMIELDKFSDAIEGKNGKTYRVKNFLGYAVPKNENYVNYIEKVKINTHAEDGSGENVSLKKNIIVLHDVGNGFRSRSSQDRWPEEIRTINKENSFLWNTVIIHYMSPPLFEGDLWDHLQQHYKKNVILIVNAEDLRSIKGVNISYSLSWEKTALDLLWEITKGFELQKIKGLSDVIICFGLGGAIYYNGDEGKASKLYFDPGAIEGRFWKEKKDGTMIGFSAVFVSSLVHRLLYKISSKKARDSLTITDRILKEGIDEGIKYGLVKKQEFIKYGHGPVEEDKKPSNPKFFDVIADKLFSENFYDEEIKLIQNVELPDVNPYNKPDQNSWKIMEHKTAVASLDTLFIAKEIVKNGLNAIKYYPIGSFGGLTTVDRAETESYRNVLNIMTEYINSENKVRPLSIAVFGSPGSGKSFGIIQIANTIDKDHVKKLEFNVSQFTSIRDLISAFHVVRDCSLKGLIPIVFFDEFDCNFQGTSLGWLRYFLVPMQDGKFSDRGIMHPIGKSIFVFAGGVYEKFADFCASTGVDLSVKNDQTTTKNSTLNILSTEKCPDFVSRLRGYVNILGLNPTNEKDNKDDNAYIIRRAILLRSLIERKAPNLITSPNGNIKTGKIEDNKLDQDLLELLLKDARYKHEIRSMEALLDMSIFEKHNKWNLASLPSKEQLDLHIEVDSSTLYKNQYYDKTEEQYLNIIKNNPKDANTYLNYGIYLRDNKRIGEAEKQFKIAIDLDPSNVNTYAHCVYGDILKKIGKDKEAEEQYKIAIKKLDLEIGHKSENG
jgi:hypothetical protein